MNLAFGSPRIVPTPWGDRIQELARPTQEFWRLWRSAPDTLKSLGLFVKKEGDNWIVGRMRSPDGEPAPETAGYRLRDNSNLRPYQIGHAGALVASLLRNRHALDGSDTGTGKTFTALAATRELKLMPGIICTRRNISKWSSLCELFKIRPLFIAHWEHAKTGKLPYAVVAKSGRKAINFDWRLQAEKTLLILDEAHKARGEGTIASQMLIRAKPYISLMLSASFASSPKDMRALGYVVGLHDLANFRKWCQEYFCFELESEDRGDRWETINPAEQMLRLNKVLFPAHGSRMRKADIPEFPETQITAELFEIDHPETQNAAYNRLITEVSKAIQKGDGDSEAKGIHPFTLNLRYRQLAEILKVDLLADLAREDIENGMSVAIFVNFTETLRALAEKLKTKCIVAGEGVQPHNKTMAAIREFQEDRSRIIILNGEAGGDSIDLHDTRGQFSRSSLIAPTYNPITLLQILGRVQRDGGKSKSIQRLIYSKGTIEEKVFAKVAPKLAAINSLNDGDLAEPEIFTMLGGQS